MSNKTKKIVGFGLLLMTLIIVKLFYGGKYLYHFWEELIPEILVLLIISFLLMIVPFVFKLVNKKKLKYEKGKIVCLLNSLILFIIFSIPNLVTILKGNGNIGGMSIDPVSFSKSLILVYCVIAIVYYYINMLFFVDNKK